jgi:hypothetical protein
MIVTASHWVGVALQRQMRILEPLYRLARREGEEVRFPGASPLDPLRSAPPADREDAHARDSRPPGLA